MKKIVMMVGVIAAALGALADTWTDPETGIEWTYTVSDGEVSVGDGWDAAVPFSTTGDITIPSTLGGYPVTSFGDYAFSDCSGLTSVTIPSSVTSIGSCAFMYCDALTIMTIPGSVTNIGKSAFEHCSGLTMFVVDTKNANYKSVNGLLLTKDGTTLIAGINGSVTIPEGVTSIGDFTFEDCRGLTSVTIPSSVTSIGGWAFCGCSGLTSVTIPSSVTSIGEEAFSWCSGLKSVTIPSSVMSVGNDAFWNCGNLTTVYVFKGDGDRVKQMICNSVANASSFDVSKLRFVVIGGGASDDGGFTGEKAAVFNGLVYDADGVVCGIVQVTTGKATKKGVKVGGFVMLEDGKKQTIKSSMVAIQDGYVKVSTKVGKIGTAAITVGGDGFKGTLGSMTLASAETDENTGILSGTLKMSYFDAKTGKIKTKSIKIGGVTADGEAVGSATIKGQATKSFSAEVE